MKFGMRALFWILFAFQFCFTKELPFAFLGVITDYQPDFAIRLQLRIFEALEDIKIIDPFSEDEIHEFQVQGFLPKQLPSDEEVVKITEALGTIVLSTVYFNKIIESASNNLWPPFSVDVVYKATVELVVLETREGKILYSGKIGGSTKFVKYFTLMTSATREPIVDALDKNKALNKLMLVLSEKVTQRLKQVLAEYSIPE